MKTGWRSITWLGVGIVAAIFFADVVMGNIYKISAKRQVRVGLSDLNHIPEVLVVSSSHGRSFHYIGNRLAERTDGRVNLVAVPLEAGKVDAMEWVLHNRIKPLITDDAGITREPLSHVMFGITWWDTCQAEVPTQTARNIVTHGWTYSHYYADVASAGANELNRNFVRNFWRHSFSGSALVRTRFAISENYSRFTNFLRALILGKFPDDEYEQSLALWNSDIDNGYQCFLSPVHMDAMDRFVDWTKQNKLDLSLVLFPLKPATITDVGLSNTILPFTKAMEEYSEKNDIRLIDLTLGILPDDEFMLDFDHLTPEGNEKLTVQTLDNEMKFLFDISNEVAPE